MGLDISYFSGLAPAPDADPDDYENVFVARKNGAFPGRADDLTDDGIYMFANSGHFGAGSYSGYNDWRESLAKLAGYPAIDGDPRKRHSRGAWEASTEGPFWELINFSDCDGVIGAMVSSKLAADFSTYQDRVPADDPWFADLYAKWRSSFETAADNGAVDFH